MRFRNGIIIGMVAFMAFILTLVIIISSKGSELTSDDYYVKDQNFQAEINARQTASDLGNPAKVRVSNDTLSVSFTDNSTVSDVELSFIRPNDKSLDRTIKISKIPALIPISFLKKGNYKVEIVFKVKGKNCEQVEDITIK
ncbi:MAG: hypothetical protein EBQ94_10085 [Flavobacteriales bacterium]|jgi:hypothetical protein|nr:hypothetical protein [Crocinitomicaceae bacterium]NBX80705.1 hypothetical protein [Flavobacteriales bacterium]NCA20294.1 hypothetical protein [Crocinitomicaceae bacterium]